MNLEWISSECCLVRQSQCVPQAIIALPFLFCSLFALPFSLFWCEWIKMKAQHVRPIPWINQMKTSKHFLQYDLRHRVFCFLIPSFSFSFIQFSSSVNIFSFCLINWQPVCVITFYGRSDMRNVLYAIWRNTSKCMRCGHSGALDNRFATHLSQFNAISYVRLWSISPGLMWLRINVCRDGSIGLGKPRTPIHRYPWSMANGWVLRAHKPALINTLKGKIHLDVPLPCTYFLRRLQKKKAVKNIHHFGDTRNYRNANSLLVRRGRKRQEIRKTLISELNHVSCFN